MRKKTIFLGLLIGGIFLFGAFVQASGQNPVILVPGISASWNWDVMAGKAFGDKWGFLPGVHIYDSLIGALKNAGYQKGKDLFVAFYDWRKPNGLTAFNYLKPVINKAKTLSGKAKVDIVAHSMGGLVARSYIEADNYGGDVERLIILGTPSHGSSDIYSVWEGGVIPKNWGKSYKFTLDTYLWYLTHFIHHKGSRYETIHQYIPSLGEMMPTYDFLEKLNLAGSTDPVPYQEMKVQNPFLENLNDGPHLKRLFERVLISNLAGEGEATVGNIVVDPTLSQPKLWKDGKPRPFPPPKNDTQGDNRVLKKSSVLINLGILPMPGSPLPPPQNGFIEFGNYRAGVFSGTKHTALPHKAIPEVLYWLNHTLSPSPFPMMHIGPPIMTASTPIPAPYPEFEDSLDFFFGEHIKPKITAPDGSYITASTSTIPYSEYDAPPGPDGPKIITIPNPQEGEYKIELKGIQDDKNCEFAAYYSSNSASEIENFSTAITTGENKSFQLYFDASRESNLIGSPQSYSIDDLMSEVRSLIEQGKILEGERCFAVNFPYQVVQSSTVSDFVHLQMGKLDAGEKKCLKLESWIETNNNKYQAASAEYDIIFNARQVGHLQD